MKQVLRGSLFTLRALGVVALCATAVLLASLPYLLLVVMAGCVLPAESAGGPCVSKNYLDELEACNAKSATCEASIRCENELRVLCNRPLRTGSCE